jgi:hypothetical protein
MKDSVNLMNHRKVIDAHDSKSERGQKFLMALYRNHKDTMTEKFGRQTRTFTGNVRHWVWDIVFEERIFRVFCSKRGTSYEIDYPEGIEAFYEDGAIGDKCIRFLEYMFKRLTDTKGRHDKRS